jgi:hypothetical protein
MALFRLTARPIARAEQEFRDDRLFIVACDDTYAPKQYFGFFKIPRVHVHVVSTDDGTSSAPHVLNRLLEIEHDNDDELWIILDTDHCIFGSHLPTFISAISMAKQRRVNVAVSRPSFELWLLLHHVSEDEVRLLTNAQEVELKLRSVLGEYNKTRLQAEHFLLDAVPVACERAEKLDSTIGGGDIPDGNCTRVHLLWKSIISKSARSQLPFELQKLAQ